MKTKLMTLQDATGFFRDGMTIMVGGFMGIGTPSRLVEALLESGVRDLTLIANDTAFVDTGIGPLIVNGIIRIQIASHALKKEIKVLKLRKGLRERFRYPGMPKVIGVRVHEAGIGDGLHHRIQRGV